MLAIVPATSVIADPPPGGWGRDCVSWTNYYNPVTTAELIYDPVGGFYRDCVTGYEVVWPAFQIDLWIELEIMVHFDWTLAQIHRVSAYDSIQLVMGGWIEQNGGNYIVVRPLGSDPNGLPYDLDRMNFIHDVLNRPSLGSHIPVTWFWANGAPGPPWSPMTPDGNNYIFLIEAPCHTDFWIRIMIAPEMHQDDGFYKLHGDLCPLANL
jgi:hypothetical protein